MGFATNLPGKRGQVFSTYVKDYDNLMKQTFGKPTYGTFKKPKS
jgi:hypothetical protein